MMEQGYWDFLNDKRVEALEKIKPYCDLFGIDNYDYFVNTNSGGEVLKLNNTYIGCTCNSMLAIVDEVIGYIIINRYCKNRTFGAFRKQTMNAVKQYWIPCPDWVERSDNNAE